MRKSASVASHSEPLRLNPLLASEFFLLSEEQFRRGSMFVLMPSHRDTRSHDDFLIPLEDAGVNDPEELRASLERNLSAMKAWEL